MAVPRAPRIFSIFVASIIFQQRLSAARENVQLPRFPKIRQLAFEADSQEVVKNANETSRLPGEVTRQREEFKSVSLGY